MRNLFQKESVLLITVGYMERSVNKLRIAVSLEPATIIMVAVV